MEGVTVLVLNIGTLAASLTTQEALSPTRRPRPMSQIARRTPILQTRRSLRASTAGTNQEASWYA